MTASSSDLVTILGQRGVGRRHPLPTRFLAAELSVPPRVVGELVVAAIEGGALIGSTCNGSRAGYFLVADMDDLVAGTEHIRRRALSSLRRVSVLKRLAERAFGPEALPLFDLEAEGAA